MIFKIFHSTDTAEFSLLSLCIELISGVSITTEFLLLSANNN